MKVQPTSDTTMESMTTMGKVDRYIRFDDDNETSYKYILSNT